MSLKIPEMNELEKELTEAEKLDQLKAWLYPRLVIWLVLLAMVCFTLFCVIATVVLTLKVA